MDLRALRHVAAIKATGSLSKAAEALGLTQPALSKSRANLEQKLGAVIVERTHQGSQLTTLGQLVAERAGEILDETTQLYRDAELAAGGKGGLLRVGMSPRLTGGFVERFGAAVYDAHPDLRMRIVVGSRGGLTNLLIARQVDIIFCSAIPALDAQQLSVFELGEDRLAVYAHPHHALAQLDRPTLADLASFRVVAPAFLDAERLPVEGEAAAANLEFYTATDLDALMWLVLSARAPIICPTIYMADHPDRDRLRRLDLELDLPFTYVAATAHSASLIPIMRKVIGYAQAAMKPVARPDAARDEI